MRATPFTAVFSLVMLLNIVDSIANTSETTNIGIPRFHVTRMSSPPIIDGTIDFFEWQSATAISGVADQSTDASKPLIPRPTTFYLGWDPGHIYLASRTYVKAGHKPNIPVGRSPGLAYVWDAGLELNFHPMGSNIPAANQGNSYKWFLNALGYIGDTSRLSMGQQFKNWNPKFIIEAKLTDPGTAPDGGRWWEVEMKASTTDFELKGDNKPGDQWKVMLGINHFPGWMQARIPCLGPYLDPFGFNLVTLVEDSPVVQMTMDSLNNLSSDGTASLNIDVFNPKDSPVSVLLEINVAEEINIRKNLIVPPKKSSSFKLNKKLPKSIEQGHLSVQVKQNIEELFWYSAPFHVNAFPNMLISSQSLQNNTFTFETKFNPVRSWLLIKGDTYQLNDPASARALHYSLSKIDSTEQNTPSNIVASGKITNVAQYYLQEVLKLPVLQPGHYSIEAKMELQDGTFLGPIQRRFEKKDEATEYGHWWDTPHGNIKRIIPPYTPLKFKDGVIKLLGRKYVINAIGLPEFIKSNKANVSSTPARLIVTVNGKERVVGVGTPIFNEFQDWRIQFEGEAHEDNVAFKANGWVEQDGLVYVELTFGPKDSKSVTIDALRIEYPLDEKDADALLCIGPGENYSSRTTMLLPKKKQGQLWSTLDTGISGSGMTIGSFYPTVWIGSERRGLLWWADNDKGWVQNNAVPAHEAIRKDNSVVMINNIIAESTTISNARTIAFSYIATPFKPMVKGWRMTQSTEDGTFHQPFRDVRTDSKTGKKVFQNPGGGLLHVNWIHPESRYPEEWEDLWHQQKTEGFAGWAAADSIVHKFQWQDPYVARKRGFTHMSFQVFGYGRKTLENHLYDYFGAEWEPDTWHKSYADYAMYLFEAAFNRGGVRSTYWDLTFPKLFNDPLSGLAYTLPDGRIQSGYHGWNLRRFYMRLNALQADAGLLPGANGFHSTNAYVPVAMPWADAVLDGERNYNLDTTPLDWVDNMPIERMRSMSIPHSWGVPICWMANMDSDDKTKRDAAKLIQAQWVWMHDSWRNPYIPQAPKMPLSVLDWGINDPETVYIPYWRNPFVVNEHQDLLVSLWKTDGRVMLGIFNYGSRGITNASIAIDFEGLELELDQLYIKKLLGESSGDITLDRVKQALQINDLPSHRLILVGIAAPQKKELERAAQALPKQLKGSLPTSLIDYGLVSSKVAHSDPNKNTSIRCDDPNIEISTWQREDRLLLILTNLTAKFIPKAKVSVDLDLLGLVPKLPWQEFVETRDLWTSNRGSDPAVLNYHNRWLEFHSLSPNEIRLVGIRLY